ncbi:hypothetical protein F5X96DRAFT_671707 [Biscogniauxia mediterranea]|nr:hypothetical protein F5X96DRAFT_671707 [Biscogniauxia mediterranea]
MAGANGSGEVVDVETPSSSQNSGSNGAPPQYTTLDTNNPSATEDISAAFSSLKLPISVGDVTPDTCLAHLKLLFAFQTLKDDIGYTDGLWAIYDTRVLTEQQGKARPFEKGQKLDDDTARELARLREKRWALYVARAVDRYQTWWKTFQANWLTEEDMESDSAKYKTFPVVSDPLKWTDRMLPPLDYLEDCMRYGYSGLWFAGLPWKFIDDAIDTSFNYVPSKDCQAAWESLTKRKWDNCDDSYSKSLYCPACQGKNKIPWTTCGMPEHHQGQEDRGLLGEGYGDGNFTHTCFNCGTTLTREFLELARFVKDVKGLLAHNRPMPGTILENTGLPIKISSYLQDRFPRTFPNRLIKRHLRSSVLELVSPSQGPPASMNTVRRLIEKALASSSTVKNIENVKGKEALKQYRLGKDARMFTRKMMSRYWGNFTPFALELSGAVMRQGIFTEKMYKIDWLHSPAARDTMRRLIEKYSRFINIMVTNSKRIAVPTLDVDLAWHTHQLSPASYFNTMLQKTGKFIDHDDKIDENKLSDAFEWTSKTYQQLYGEVYSECTCWYCEAVRASHISSVGKALGISKNDKISESFHQSGKASLCPPDNSAHMSTHNSVRIVNTYSHHDTVHDRLQATRSARMDENYKKAQKRAQKKGRELPPKNDYYYYYWGYPYMMYGPWIYPPYFCPVYYGDPGTAVAGSGAVGACAAGTCGGAAASGACGGAATGGCGGCGGGCSGGCGSASGPACGGGGGGCGGGGGGGCGGGGGGG